MQIRVTVPVLELGPYQFNRGQIAILPDDVAQRCIDEGKATAVPLAEQAVMPRYETAVVPRTAGKPKPPAKPKGR